MTEEQYNEIIKELKYLNKKLGILNDLFSTQMYESEKKHIVSFRALNYLLKELLNRLD
jgi:hypothetical protein